MNPIFAFAPESTTPPRQSFSGPIVADEAGAKRTCRKIATA
jgi:hypothetical protein